jgi:hypothetical protein
MAFHSKSLFYSQQKPMAWLDHPKGASYSPPSRGNTRFSFAQEV